MTIYLVDDSKFMTKYLECKIKEFNSEINIISINNAAEVIKTIDIVPDTKAMIVDYNMPQINGIEFIDLIKTKYSNITFLLLSASVLFSLKQNIPENIMFIQKPITDSDLQNFIKML